MAIFPEHLHLAGEDAELHHTDRDIRYHALLDGYLAVLVIGTVLFLAAVVALMMF